MSSEHDILMSYKLSEDKIKERLRCIQKECSIHGQTLRVFLRSYWKRYGTVPSIQKLHDNFPTLNELDLALAQGVAEREFENEL